MQDFKDILQNCQEAINILREDLLQLEESALSQLKYSKSAYTSATKISYLKDYKASKQAYKDLIGHIDELEDIMKVEAYNKLIDLL